MKAFHFTLEAVRTLRLREEQEASNQYAKTLVARQQVIDKLHSLQRQLDQGWNDLRQGLTRGCSASFAAQAHLYHRSLEKRRDECNAELGVAERRVNAALQIMLRAKQQREVVDKFYEKQKDAHQREVNRDEQKLLDELAGRRAASLFAFHGNEVIQ
jgi:flagellar export protein FliJ